MRNFNLTCIFLCTVGIQFVFGQARSSILTYAQSAFDSDSCCWRVLSHDQKYIEAANLIVTYIDHHNNSINKHSLHWHAGQMYAMAGDYAAARKYFKKTYSVFYYWFGGDDGRTWYYYARGTIAFIDDDRKTLDTIINKWKEQLPLDKNYNALLQLQAHWGERYEAATSE